MDSLKAALLEGLEQAGGRKIALFAQATGGLVLAGALHFLGVEPVFCEPEDSGRVGQSWLGQPIRSLEECASSGEYFILSSREEIDFFATQHGLREGVDYSRLRGLFLYNRSTVVDPLTGTGRLADLSGFYVFESRKGNGRPLRIATLGGSTSDSGFCGARSWPEQLHDVLEEQGKDHVVYSGGTAGFSSTEERGRFLRDVLPMRPDVVLSLSGANDLIGRQRNPDHNYYSELVQGERDIAFLQELFPGERMENGLNRKMYQPERWLLNHKMIHAVAEEFGIRHLCFLQPWIGSEGYQMSEFEQGWSRWYMQNPVRSLMLAHDVFNYREAISLMAGLDYMRDLTGVYNGSPGVFIDTVHVSSDGNRILAERIADELQRL